MTTPEPPAVALESLPSWLREIDVTLSANPQVLVTGNLRDDILVPEPGRPFPSVLSVIEAIVLVLRTAGHTRVIGFDPVDGARALVSDETTDRLLGGLENIEAESVTALRHRQLAHLLRAVTSSPEPCCLVVEGASRLAGGLDFAEPEFHHTLSTAEKVLSTAVRHPVPGPHRAQLYNAVFWLLDREGDLPHWLGSSQLTRVVSVPEPALGQRREAAARVAPSLPGYAELDDTGRSELLDTFASLTSGLTLRSLAEISRLAIDRGIGVADLDDAVRTFRVGVPDNPWRDEALRERIGNGEELLGRKVKGQPAAVRKSLDILIRASMGLAGAQTSGSGSRPQGVLFFAGPTGVGKTELAKTMAELVFGRSDAFLRFDMSEFSSEHAEARLIGAPPGYIGHNAGGELTNAVRQQPFRLILFDEIEKAHPRILDKFLQVLEDGRLTDGNGSTVYFTESLIVFTSNLGVYVEENGVRVPVVKRGSPYPVVESTIRAAVSDHFVKEIGRPELLNRIGDNIVVFDFIDDETAKILVPLFVGNVRDRVLAQTGHRIALSDAATDALVAAAVTKLDFGGRGVATAVESMLVNPLARALFAVPPGRTDWTVEAIERDAEGWAVRLA